MSEPSRWILGSCLQSADAGRLGRLGRSRTKPPGSDAGPETLLVLVTSGRKALSRASRLKTLADGCENLNPKTAAEHRNESAAIREALAAEDSDAN